MRAISEMLTATFVGSFMIVGSLNLTPYKRVLVDDKWTAFSPQLTDNSSGIPVLQQLVDAFLGRPLSEFEHESKTAL